MFARRPRMNRRGIGAQPLAASSVRQIDPSDVTDVVDWWEAGLGYSGAAWLGQFAGNDLAQATANLQGTLNGSDSTLNGLPTLSFNGTSQFRRCTTIARPAPGTEFTTIIMVGKQRSWTSTGTWIANGVGTMRITQQSNTPEISQANGSTVNANDAGTLGTWLRVEALFSNTATDHVHVGPKTIHGTAAGNNSPTRITLAASDTPAAYGAIDVWFILYAAGQIPMAELSALDAYIESRAGSGLI